MSSSFTLSSKDHEAFPVKFNMTKLYKPIKMFEIYSWVTYTWSQLKTKQNYKIIKYLNHKIAENYSTQNLCYFNFPFPRVFLKTKYAWVEIWVGRQKLKAQTN